MSNAKAKRRHPPVGLTPLLAFLWLLTPGASARAQQALRITEPAAWQAGRTDTIASGTALHIAGIARQPSGVKGVLVNGQWARIEPDPTTAGQVRFDITIAGEEAARGVTIVVEPMVGTPLPRTFRVAVLGPGATRVGAGAAPAPPLARDSALTAADTANAPSMPTIVVPIALPHPWRAFEKRGIGYALLLGAGSYLATVTKTLHTEICTGPAGQQDCVDRTTVSRPSAGLGMALVAGAALGGLVDAGLTWMRARAQRGGDEPAAPRVRTGLAAPLIEPDGAGARVTFSYRF